MLTYNELIDLRARLTNGDIDLESAKEQLWKDFKEGERSWHSKDWKERRLEFLKDNCEICSGTEVLTIQHLSHPRKYSEYLTEVRRESAKEYISTNPDLDKSVFGDHLHNNYEYNPILLCPSCGGRNPNKRMRKKPHYLCTECRNEFDEPDYKTADDLISIFYENTDAIEVRDNCFITKDRWRSRHNLSNVKYWFQRETATAQYTVIMEKKAFLLYLDDNIKYLSFEDAITACKKCASNADLHNFELCPKCSVYYKGIQYPTCIQCLPDDKRKVAMESIEFGQRWAEMEKGLGID